MSIHSTLSSKSDSLRLASAVSEYTPLMAQLYSLETQGGGVTFA